MATIVNDGGEVGNVVLVGDLRDMNQTGGNFPGRFNPIAIGPSPVPVSAEGGMFVGMCRTPVGDPVNIGPIVTTGEPAVLFSGTVDPALVGGSVVGRDVYLRRRSSGIRIGKAVTDVNGDFSFPPEYYPADVDDYEFEVIGDDYVSQCFPIGVPVAHVYQDHPHLTGSTTVAP